MGQINELRSGLIYMGVLMNGKKRIQGLWFVHSWKLCVGMYGRSVQQDLHTQAWNTQEWLR